MCSRRHKRCFPALLAGLIALAATACHKHDETAAAPKTAGPAAEAPRNESPAAELSAVMEAHFQGAGFMEQYEYGKAAKAFREVRRRAPGWVPGAISLSIALLNMTGEEVEASKKSGGGSALGNFGRRSPDGARPSASRGGPVRHEGPSHPRPGAPTGER
jgi:hypothetical protein